MEDSKKIVVSLFLETFINFFCVWTWNSTVRFKKMAKKKKKAAAKKKKK